MPKSASKSATKQASMAAPPPVTRDQAKVQLLTTMVALKDEILRASDEKVRALKWAALNDFDKDAGSLEALLSQLEERVSGWRGDAPEGTTIVAPLVLKRREAVAARFSSDQVSASDFADNLAVVLPEFRRDFLEAVARNFGESVSIEAFLEACERAAGVPAVVEPEAGHARRRRDACRRIPQMPRRRRPPPPRRRRRSRPEPRPRRRRRRPRRRSPAS